MIRLIAPEEARVTITAADESPGSKVCRNLLSCLLYVSTMTSEFREHVPRDGRINYRATSTASGDSWGGVIKKIISDSAEVL